MLADAIERLRSEAGCAIAVVVAELRQKLFYHESVKFRASYHRDISERLTLRFSGRPPACHARRERAQFHRTFAPRTRSCRTRSAATGCWASRAMPLFNSGVIDVAMRQDTLRCFAISSRMARTKSLGTAMTVWSSPSKAASSSATASSSDCRS